MGALDAAVRVAVAAATSQMPEGGVVLDVRVDFEAMLSATSR